MNVMLLPGEAVLLAGGVFGVLIAGHSARGWWLRRRYRRNPDALALTDAAMRARSQVIRETPAGYAYRPVNEGEHHVRLHRRAGHHRQGTHLPLGGVPG